MKLHQSLLQHVEFRKLPMHPNRYPLSPHIPLREDGIVALSCGVVAQQGEIRFLRIQRQHRLEQPAVSRVASRRVEGYGDLPGGEIEVLLRLPVIDWGSVVECCCCGRGTTQTAGTALAKGETANNTPQTTVASAVGSAVVLGSTVDEVARVTATAEFFQIVVGGAVSRSFDSKES